MVLHLFIVAYLAIICHILTYMYHIHIYSIPNFQTIKFTFSIDIDEMIYIPVSCLSVQCFLVAFAGFTGSLSEINSSGNQNKENPLRKTWR